MRFNNPYWSNKLKISTLQRWIIVHSLLYYEMSNSIISDQEFDKNAYQLVELQKCFQEDAKHSDYWYVFYDFDANTGYYIYDRLNEHDKERLTNIAEHVLKLYKSKRRKRNGSYKNDSRK